MHIHVWVLCPDVDLDKSVYVYHICIFFYFSIILADQLQVLRNNEVENTDTAVIDIIDLEPLSNNSDFDQESDELLGNVSALLELSYDTNL